MPKKSTVKGKAKQDKPESAPSDEVMDLRTAADFLKISKPTFYRWLAQGRIKGFKAGQQWRFYRRDLEKFLETEEPVVAQEGADELRKAIDQSRAARGLAPVDWSLAGEETAEEAVIPRAADVLISDAIDARASDIHLDPDRDGTFVRYRIDGVLTPVMLLPRKAHAPVVSRLKLRADCDVTERRLPANGRIAVSHLGRDYDVRLQTMPAVFGEAANMRILDQSSVLIGLDKLGWSKPVRQAFERKLRDSQGLIIVTGPTGSGRTTTLYSALNMIASPEKKVVTIEDPVEYRLPGIMQVHVNRRAGLTFIVGARTFLRCDPDIIVIGDLRDLETAEVCTQAAMTGHIVLTTLLPHDAPSAITRLLDMGVEPLLITASLSAVLAQRLLRMVCPSCKTEYKPSAAVLRRLGMTDDEIRRAKFYRGAGCDQCLRTGHYGRTGVFELLEVNDRLREMIAGCPTTEQLRAAAVESGMVTMLQDGLEKAKQGVTTVEELVRVLAKRDE